MACRNFAFQDTTHVVSEDRHRGEYERRCMTITNPAQWEILGELAQRLHHTEEAKDAFQRCLDSKFSAKAWMKLLEMYSEENDLERALNAAIRLTTYQHR